MAMTTLIYCAAGNKRFAEIAIRHGYQYGAQLPHTIYFNPYFTDQNWKAPKREKYMDCLKQYRPMIATVLDWEHDGQFAEVIDWAEQASQYVQEAVIIIPKVVGGIRRLPRTLNGKEVRLGYSAASTFSSTPVALDEFTGHPVHCLGGSPRRQMEIARTQNLQSADGNFIQQCARMRCQFFSPSIRAKNNGWPILKEVGLSLVKKDAIYLAFELTCIGVPMAWAGSVLSALLSVNAIPIAIASFVAFAFSESADALTYALLHDRAKMIKVNGSNIVSAAVDSLIFPILAFGWPPLWGIIIGQFVAKVFGGFLWSLILPRLSKSWIAGWRVLAWL